MEKLRCQSCGMPLGPGFFGTEKNGKESATYCRLCYKKGEFADQDLTVNDMIDLSTQHMVTELGMDPEIAREKAEAFIPKLKRWQ